MPTASAQALDLASLGWLGYLRQPDRFCREMLHSFNDPWQAAALAHLNDPACSALFIVSCHGTGKTRLASHAIYHAGLAWGSRVRIPCTAPKQQLLAEKLWPELFKVHTGADPMIRDACEWSKTHLRFFDAPGWEAIAETAKDVEGLAGHHEDRVLFICEEATGIDEEFWPVILGALSQGGKLLAISNYTRTSGYFAERFTKNRDGEVLMRVAWNPQGVPGVEPKDTTRPYLWRTRSGAAVETWYSDRPKAAWAQKIIAEYGWDSTLTRVRVRGLPPLSDAEALVPGELVWAAWGRELPAQPQIHPVTWAWDVAGAGRDLSVLTRRQGPLVRGIHATPETNLYLQALQLEAEIRDEHPEIVNIDDVGLGQGPQDQLVARGLNVNGVNVGAAPPENEKDEYANLRACLYWRLRKGFVDGTICLSRAIPEATIKALVEELEATRWGFATESNKIRIQPKDAIKAKLGRSPDHADSLMLSEYDAMSCGTGEIGAFGGVGYESY